MQGSGNIASEEKMIVPAQYLQCMMDRARLSFVATTSPVATATTTVAPRAASVTATTISFIATAVTATATVTSAAITWEIKYVLP